MRGRFFICEGVFVLLLGAVGYGLCETLWRGYTHWTMVCLGGVCFGCIYYAEKIFRPLPLCVRCASGGVFICAMELITGSIVNVFFGMQVWDYSALPLNIGGQVCLQFLFLWMLICVPALYLCDVICEKFNEIYV